MVRCKKCDRWSEQTKPMIGLDIDGWICRQCAHAEFRRLQDEVERLRAELDDIQQATEVVAPGIVQDEVERLREKLSRIRDWLKYAANSEGGIVAEIDGALTAAEAAKEERGGQMR